MKNNKVFINLVIVLITGSMTMFAQETGVVINGVKWATRNVDVPGTFTENPESIGMIYQWNKNKAWPATGKVTGWNPSNASGNTWEKSNDPSPAGWRVPTYEEIKQLIDTVKVKNEFVSVNGAWGQRFTDKETSNTIFIPFSPNRKYTDGSINSNLSSGYWSSTQADNDGGKAKGFLLILNQIAEITGQRSSGHLVRPVAE